MSSAAARAWRRVSCFLLSVVSDWPNSETLYLMKAATKTGTTEIGGREIVWAIRRLVFGQKADWILRIVRGGR